MATNLRGLRSAFDATQTSGEHYRAKPWRQQQRLTECRWGGGLLEKVSGSLSAATTPMLLLLAGRLVRAAKLACLFANLQDFFLRK